MRRSLLSFLGSLGSLVPRFSRSARSSRFSGFSRSSCYSRSSRSSRSSRFSRFSRFRLVSLINHSFPSSYSSCVSPSLFMLSLLPLYLTSLLFCLFLSSREDWTAFYSKEAPTSSDYTLIRFVPHTVEAVHYDLKINPGNNWRPFTLVKSPDESKWRRE